MNAEASQDIRAVEELKQAHDRIMGEVRKVIVGQTQVIEDLLIAHSVERPLSSRRRARAREDAPRLHARARARSRVLAHPVHARSHALGHHRHRCAGRGRNESPRVPLHQGPGVREHRARRRDQPHAAEDAGGAAPGDAGERSDRGRRDAIRSRRRSSCSPRRTRSSRKARIRFPKRSSTASCSTSRWAIRRWTRSAASWKRPRRRYAAKLDKVLGAADILRLQTLVRRVPVAADVVQYAVRLARASRPKTDDAPKFVKDWVSWGAGPRATQYLVLGAKTRAILDGRYTPTTEDVRAVARAVLRHRIVTNFNAEAEGIDGVTIVDQLVEHVAAGRCGRRVTALPRRRRRRQARRPSRARALGRRGLRRRSAPEPVQGLLGRVRRASPVHRRRPAEERRLEGVREVRSLLREGVRGRDEPPRVPRARRLRLDGLRLGSARRSSSTRARSPPRSPTSCSASRTRSGCSSSIAEFAGSFRRDRPAIICTFSFKNWKRRRPRPRPSWPKRCTDWPNA